MRGTAHRTLTFGLSVRVAEQNRRVTWKSEWNREERGIYAVKEDQAKSLKVISSEFSVNSFVRKS